MCNVNFHVFELLSDDFHVLDRDVVGVLLEQLLGQLPNPFFVLYDSWGEMKARNA